MTQFETPDASTRDAFAEAALRLARERSPRLVWSKITLHDLAAEAGRPIADFHPLAPADAFLLVEDYFDRAAAAGATAPAGETSLRERVFDAAMRRFEAMEPHRAGVLALERAGDGDPVALAGRVVSEARTARWLLTLAGAPLYYIPGLALVLARARAGWRRDEAGDFAATMAALDKGLREGEDFLGSVARVGARLWGPFKPRARSEPPADAASPAGPPAD